MKQITPHADITLTDPDTGKPGDTISFRFVAVGRWINSKKTAEILTDIAKLLQWGKVIDKLKAAVAGKPFLLEDADYDLLKIIVTADAVTHAPTLGLQLLPFYQNVIDATTPADIPAPPEVIAAP